MGEQQRRGRVGFWLALGAATLIAGCATTTNVKLPDPEGETSLIEYVRQLRLASATLGDAAIVRLHSAVPDDYPDYRWWWQTWCPRHEQLSSGAQLMDFVHAFCRVHGGQFIEGVCVDPIDETHVRFIARLNSGTATCGGVAVPVGIQIAEPKPGGERSSAFLEVLHNAGWRSRAERLAAADANAKRNADTLAAEADAHREELERVQRELPQLRTRGTRICRTQGAWKWIGYTEDATDKKIQIRIAEVRSATHPESNNRPDNYIPDQIVWDLPERWRVCE